MYRTTTTTGYSSPSEGKYTNDYGKFVRKMFTSPGVDTKSKLAVDDHTDCVLPDVTPAVLLKMELMDAQATEDSRKSMYSPLELMHSQSSRAINEASFKPHNPLVYQPKQSPEYMANLYRNNFKEDPYRFRVGAHFCQLFICPITGRR